MWRALMCVLASVMLSSAVRAQEGGQTKDVSIGVCAEANDILFGEPLYVVGWVRNVSNRTLTLPQWGSWAVTLGDANGNRRTMTYAYGRASSVGGDSIKSVSPMETVVFRERFFWTVLCAKGMASPGRYEFKFNVDSDGNAWVYKGQGPPYLSGETPSLTRCWAGRAASTACVVNVRPVQDPNDKAALALLMGKSNDVASMWGYGMWDRWKTVLERYPQSVFARHCRFALAGEWGERREWDSAIEDYDRVLRDYPSFWLTDDAILGMAKAHKAKDGDRTRQKAVDLLKGLLEKHPDADTVDEAKRLLGDLLRDEPGTVRPPVLPASGEAGGARPEPSVEGGMRRPE